eukprot:gnl/Spiro4/3811_TR1883_c0_g1_i2.p1 gnl/Spiro4/3811_TR1883_c0_g1~~gnl/Spiro4/3811_TR1883_c0_g1_i2.p1  ORF type:complete len:229 (+),score=51.63 gnl/Spiro4/3811_TR1883_c0_g1_i2:65-751(+)
MQGKRARPAMISFDSTERREFVTGFHKRKNARRAEAVEQQKKKERRAKIRERKADKFALGPERIRLEEIDPTCAAYDVDWIIGNHSDELTPWIPLIAARSSYRTKFMLLPCCFHDFTHKFAQNNIKLGQYKTYITYLEKICQALGFEIDVDVLRIPSTKNVALVARRRAYPVECYAERLAALPELQRQLVQASMLKAKKRAGTSTSEAPPEEEVSFSRRVAQSSHKHR